MARSAKPRKKYRPKPEGDARMRTRPEVVRKVFQPFDELLDQIETHGTIDVIQGRAVYQDIEGDWYDLVAAGDGFCEAFRMKKDRYDYDVEPLQQLINRIKYGAPLTPKETTAARIALDKIRRAVLGMKVSEAKGLVRDAQIKFELINKKLLAEAA